MSKYPIRLILTAVFMLNNQDGIVLRCCGRLGTMKCPVLLSLQASCRCGIHCTFCRSNLTRCKMPRLLAQNKEYLLNVWFLAQIFNALVESQPPPLFGFCYFEVNNYRRQVTDNNQNVQKNVHCLKTFLSCRVKPVIYYTLHGLLVLDCVLFTGYWPLTYVLLPEISSFFSRKAVLCLLQHRILYIMKFQFWNTRRYMKWFSNKKLIPHLLAV